MRRADRLAIQPRSTAAPRHRNGKVVVPAVVASLGLHAALAVLLVHGERKPPQHSADTVELVVADVAEPAPTQGPVPASAADIAQRPPRSRAGVTAKAASTPAFIRHGSGPGDAPPPTTSPAPAGPQAEPGAAAGPSATGWTTFLPARPDLDVAGKLAPPPEPPRDLLAAPTARPALAQPALPRTLQGGSGVTADVSEDGAIRFHDAKKLGYDVASARGHFDLTDTIMRRGGQDPYASAKRKLADDTREQRICMAKRAQDQRQSQALLGLATHVKQIARRVDLTPLERRQIVFEIWDECSEQRGAAAVDHGATARAIIAAVIREIFPAGSELGYSTSELASLNQRRGSRDRFAPYDVKHDAGVAPEPRPADNDCP